MFAHQDDPVIKPEWIGGKALLGINKLEQFMANKALSSFSLYPHMKDHSPSEHFGHLDNSDSTKQEILKRLGNLQPLTMGTALFSMNHMEQRMV